MGAHLRGIPSLIIMALVVAASTVPAFAGEEGHFDRTLAVTGAVDLTVQTGSGAIAVRRGASSKVEIHGTIHADHGHVGGNVEARIQEIEMNPPIEQSGNTIRVGHFDDHDRERGISISYELIVPSESKLRAESGSGGQTVEGIHGPVEANTGSGNQRFANIGGEVRARAGSGEIELNSISGSVHAKAGSGTIRALGIAGGLTASSGSGNITLEQTSAGDVEISTGSGEIEIKGAKGAVKATTGSGSIHAQGQPASEWCLRSGSGNVTAELPKGAAFDLIARSNSGPIETSHELNVEATINRSELRGSANGGGVLVDLTTSSGSIIIR
jgi:DUF4097 and DUF4098 domain-containing protein YvlB